MNDVARIACGRGAFYLAASTPYERELVLEHSGLCARRYLSVQLQLDEREWVIAPPRPSAAIRCHRCHERARWLIYTEGTLTLCQPCAREDIKGGAPGLVAGADRGASPQSGGLAVRH